MTSIEDERKAAMEARNILQSIVTSATKEEIDTLRKAYLTATKAMGQGFSSQAGLDEPRNAAVNALTEVCGLWDRGSLAAEKITHAKDAVKAWLTALEGCR
jgi:hypothetical protein